MDDPASPFPLEPSPENVRMAREFVLQCWRARAAELGREEPHDLSSSCMFSSLFAQAVFGGEIRGNYEHQFVALSDGRILDLNESADDVRFLRERSLTQPHGWHRPNPRIFWHQVWISDPHDHDPAWFGCPDHLESMRSCQPRVQHWLALFAQKLLADAAPDRSLEETTPAGFGR